MFAAMSYGWNLIGGYTGYVCSGTSCSSGSEPTAAPRSRRTGSTISSLGIAIALAVSGAFAAIVGLPILRLRGHYFGIATLGISLAVADLVDNLDALGGSGGLALKQFDASHFVIYYYAMWAVARRVDARNVLDRPLEARLRIRRDS